MTANATLTLHFDENEVMDLWNIVMFAKDLHNERAKNGESCMTQRELDLANKIIGITENIK